MNHNDTDTSNSQNESTGSWLSLFIRKMIGERDKFTLENRFFNGASCLTIAICLISFYWNYSLGFSPYIHIVVGIFLIAFSFFYYYARVKLRFFSFLYIIFALIALSLIWFISEGSKGSSPMLYVLMVAFFIAISKTRFHIFYLALTVLNIAILFVLEKLYYDKLIIQYPTAEARELDVLFAFAASIIIIYLLLNFFKKNYEAENIIINVQKQELEIHRSHLEDLVNERTRELVKTVNELRKEIVKHDQSKESLNESNERYKALFERSRDCIYLSDLEGNFVDANGASLDLFGYTREEIESVNFATLLDEKQIPLAFETLEEIINTGSQKRMVEYQVRKKNGKYAWVETTASMIYKNGKAALIQGIARDITERKKLEIERTRLVKVIEQSNDSIVITDLEGRIEYVNHAFEQMTGYAKAEAFGENPRILKSGKQDDLFYQELWETISSGKTWIGNLINKRKTGELFEEMTTIFPVFDTEGEITNYTAVKRDLTEQNKMECQLRQAQKLEAVGTLASGIAHDFNNILGAIFGFTQLSKKKLPDPFMRHKVVEYLDKIHSAAGRAKDLIDQILTFSRKGEYNPENIFLQPLVEESIKFLKAALPTTISINFNSEPDLRSVQADATQIQQVIMNLCTNASHAMEEMGGILEIGLSNYRINSKTAITGDLVPGDYLLLSVSDTGKGMNEQTMQQIYEPFYTTKEQGKGTGLGLSVVHGIVSKHEGIIKVYSQEGAGTKFNIYLPAQSNDTLASKQEDEPALATGSESILFVDDEIDLCVAYGEMLKLQGYKVQAISSSQKALNKFKKNPDGYDLVITDYTMPEMDGIRLINEIHKLRTNLPVILISGLGTQLSIKEIESPSIMATLSKPIEIEKLVQTVRDILDAKQ
ncbi:MAG: PAS domain S-box protein [Deltaproteobacteria bacterium]|nr:PAS domain S-box protein [Deltaproteobacteria bacterium]